MELVVIHMHTIKPIDREAIIDAVKNSRRILTIEEHNTFGGLGSAVAEVIVESGVSCAFEKAGIPDEFSIVGYPEVRFNAEKPTKPAIF